MKYFWSQVHPHMERTRGVRLAVGQRPQLYTNMVIPTRIASHSPAPSGCRSGRLGHAGRARWAGSVRGSARAINTCARHVSRVEPWMTCWTRCLRCAPSGFWGRLPRWYSGSKRWCACWSLTRCRCSCHLSSIPRILVLRLLRLSSFWIQGRS